jgi:hypothetical protein
MSPSKAIKENAECTEVGNWEDYLKTYYEKPQSTRT